jgi:hypothetical protein
LVNAEQAENENRTAVQHSGRLLVEIGEQQFQSPGDFAGVWSVEEDFQPIGSIGADYAGKLEKTAEDAEGILGFW